MTRIRLSLLVVAIALLSIVASPAAAKRIYIVKQPDGKLVTVDPDDTWMNRLRMAWHKIPGVPRARRPVTGLSGFGGSMNQAQISSAPTMRENFDRHVKSAAVAASNVPVVGVAAEPFAQPNATRRPERHFHIPFLSKKR